MQFLHKKKTKIWNFKPQKKKKILQTKCLKIKNVTIMGVHQLLGQRVGRGGEGGGHQKKKNAFDELPKKGASTICRWVTKKQGGEFF